MSDAAEPVTTSYLRALLIERLSGERSRGHWERMVGEIVIKPIPIDGANWWVRTTAKPGDAQLIEIAVFAVMAQYPLAVEG